VVNLLVLSVYIHGTIGSFGRGASHPERRPEKPLRYTNGVESSRRPTSPRFWSFYSSISGQYLHLVGEDGTKEFQMLPGPEQFSA
jgi:hypothetical protein